MERSHHLLVLGLLAALLPAAAATFGTTQPEPGAPCEPTLLATQVSLFCAPDMPTAQCCEPVVASVDLGGGVPCLCRVAAEPQLVMAGLNATHLLTLYTSCGGLRPGGAHLAAACEGPAPPAAVVSAPPPSAAPRRKQPARPAPLAAVVSAPPPSAAPRRKQPARALIATRCNSHSAALLLVRVCGTTESRPSRLCCAQVVRIVDTDCLCEVEDEPVTTSVPLDTVHMWFLYRTCRGTRPIPTDRTRCESVTSPPPPPPPAPTPPRSPTSDKFEKLVSGEKIALYVVSAVVVAVCATILVALVWHLLRARTASAIQGSVADVGAVRADQSEAASDKYKTASPSPTIMRTPATTPSPAIMRTPTRTSPVFSTLIQSSPARLATPVPSPMRHADPIPSAPPAPSSLLFE